jgi:hypothetical protein
MPEPPQTPAPSRPARLSLASAPSAVTVSSTERRPEGEFESGDELSAADQAIFLEDFKKEVSLGASEGGDIVVNDEVRMCLDMILAASSVKKMTAKQRHDSHHAQ